VSDGPGKYDAEATRVMERTDAEGVMVLVIAGSKGSGFSTQGSWRALAAAPRLLREVADQIDRDVARGGPDAPGRHVTIRPKGRA